MTLGQFSNSFPKHFSYLCEYAFRFDQSCSFCEYPIIFYCLHCSPSCFDPDSLLLAYYWLGYPGLTLIYCISTNKSFSSPKTSSRNPTPTASRRRDKNTVLKTLQTFLVPPPPTARPLGGLLGSAIHVLWAQVCGCGGPSLSPWSARPVGAVRRGAGSWRSCAEGRLGGGEGGGVRRIPRLCGRGGPVGRGVALPRSVPLPPLGRQQSGCYWRHSVHGGRGPPYHSGSCLPAFTGRDLCGVLARWRGLACSPRPLWEPAAGAGGAARAPAPLSGGGGGGGIPPALEGWGGGPRGLRAGGGGGGGVAPRPPCSPSGWRPAVPHPGPPRVVGALPSGVRVQSGSWSRPGVGGGEGRPVDRSPGGPCRPGPPLCPP